jgi:hypothetical protein
MIVEERFGVGIVPGRIAFHGGVRPLAPSTLEPRGLRPSAPNQSTKRQRPCAASHSRSIGPSWDYRVMGSPVHGIARLRDLVLGLKPANLIPHLGAYGLGRDAGEDPGEHGAFLIIDGSVFERESLEHGEFPGIDRIVVPEYGKERVLHDGVRVGGLFHRSRFPSGWCRVAGTRAQRRITDRPAVR